MVTTSDESAASNSITATTVPQSISITSLVSFVTNQVQIFTSSGATGGKAITSATATPSPALSVTTAIASATSFTATGSYALGQAYQFTISRTNANGTSSISGISSSITPNP